MGNPHAKDMKPYQGIPMHEFVAEIKHETDKAYLLDDGEEEYWIPKSQVENECHIRGDTWRFEIPVWLAEDKGIV